MGGNLLLNYLLRRNPDVAAAVVSAPYIKLTTPANPLLVFMARVMRYVYPSFSQSNTLELEELSRDPAVAAAAEADPHYHDRITVETALATIDAGKYLDHFTGTVKRPLLLMHGTADRITDPQATERFAERLKGPVVYKPWPGLYHELHNEPEQQQVFDFVLNWVEANINQNDAQRELKSV
jgi:alpha-beta hydrolase superfamily lysophospholipase